MKAAQSAFLALLLVCGWSGASGAVNAAAVNQPQASTLSADKPYFFVKQGKAKCFYENTPDKLAMTVTYANYDNPGMACVLSIRDPNQVEVSHRVIRQPVLDGKLSYLTKSAGQHSVCVHCTSPKWFGNDNLKWSLSVDLGDTDIDLKSAARGSEIKTQTQLLLGIRNRINKLLQQHEYRSDQGATWHKATRSLEARLVTCGILQVVILGAATLTAVMHLSRFFKAEKLV